MVMKGWVIIGFFLNILELSIFDQIRFLDVKCVMK